jgi:hypothetical protein
MYLSLCLSVPLSLGDGITDCVYTFVYGGGQGVIVCGRVYV